MVMHACMHAYMHAYMHAGAGYYQLGVIQEDREKDLHSAYKSFVQVCMYVCL
jgi:hypothetical protein